MGGVYPQPPRSRPDPEAPNGSGPGAGHGVDRNSPLGSGDDLAIIALGASPQPKAILAGRAVRGPRIFLARLARFGR